MSRRPTVLLLALALPLALLAGCGGEAEAPAARPPLDRVEVGGSVGDGLTVDLADPVRTDEPVGEMVATGKGDRIDPNDAVLVHLYIGNGTSGRQAVNTYEAGPPVQVSMSPDQLFSPVVDELVGKPAGSRVKIAAPAADVWGEQGAPQLKIKPTDTAVFVADVLSVQADDVRDAPSGTPVDPTAEAPGIVERGGAVTGFDWSKAPEQAPEDLTVIPLIEGDGPAVPPQSIVTFDYFGAVYGGEEPFDESYSRQPAPFGVGVGGLIPAWDQVIPELTEGSRVMIIAPPAQAYGDTDRPGIPGGSTLVFVVDVLAVDA